jgi:hypothetical protein
MELAKIVERRFQDSFKSFDNPIIFEEICQNIKNNTIVKMFN